MEFIGRIAKLLPMRSGTSQKTGNEWKALPFVFEYFENPSDRYADRVLLETFDTNVIHHLKEGMEVKIGFGHHTREHEGKIYNELRMYKIEGLKKVTEPAAQPPKPTTTPPVQQTDANQVNWDSMGGSAEQQGNDLPF